MFSKGHSSTSVHVVMVIAKMVEFVYCKCLNYICNTSKASQMYYICV